MDGIRRRRGRGHPTTKNIGSSIFILTLFVLGSSLLFIIWRTNLSSITKYDAAMHDEDLPQSPESDGNIKKSPYQSRNRSSSEDEVNIWDEIIRGEIHLVEIDAGGIRRTKDGYRGGMAAFCKLDWDTYKENSPSLPMFRFLVSKSGCDGRKNRVVVDDLPMIVKKMKEYDDSLKPSSRRDIRSMNPTGFVFHESRVGSTLVANSLTAMSAANRVFSESNPINTALKTDIPQLLRDVVYLMGRTNKAEEQNLFFKVSSIGSKRISVFREAFRDTPWIFVYRDPLQTMMSHLDPAKVGTRKNGRIMAVCTRARHDPPRDLNDLVERHGKRIETLSDHQFCAAHLASLCDSALSELKKPNNNGRAVEYDGLIDKLLDDIIPNHFGVTIDNDARQRVLKVSKTYSKSKNQGVDWVEDSGEKEAKSTPEIRSASQLFLSQSYAELKEYTL